MKSKRSISLFDGVIVKMSYIVVAVFALVCLIPFYLIIVASFSEEVDVLREGFSIFPKHFTMEAYRMVFRVPETIIRAYGVTLFVTIVGTVIALFLTAMTAYVLSRHTCKYRNGLAFFFYFSSLFSGGMVPSYILISQYLHLKDNIFVLILPILLNAWNIFLMRNFMQDIPEEISEAATIDGANQFQIFLKLYMPLAKPGLATVGLFIALMYWNDWYHAMLYINKPDLYPLQYLLHDMLSSIRGLQQAASQANIPVAEMPSETFKMAMAIVSTGPIILLYPMVQKYFIKGLTVGAVKG